MGAVSVKNEYSDVRVPNSLSLTHKLSGGTIRIFRPLLKVNMLAYRVDIADALFPEGSPNGEVSGSPIDRMLFIGDAAIAGYGVRHHGLGLASQAARRAARQRVRGSEWNTIGDPELTMARASALPELDNDTFDAIVVALGPPDVLLGTGGTAWSESIDRLVERVLHTQGSSCSVIISAIPPMNRFRRMPGFVQRILALQLGRLNRATRAAAARHPNVTYSPFPHLETSGVVIQDKFNWRTVHALWGKQLGETISTALDRAAPHSRPPAP